MYISLYSIFNVSSAGNKNGTGDSAGNLLFAPWRKSVVESGKKGTCALGNLYRFPLDIPTYNTFYIYIYRCTTIYYRHIYIYIYLFMHIYNN